VVLRYLRYMVWDRMLLILHSLEVCQKSVDSPLMRWDIYVTLILLFLLIKFHISSEKMQIFFQLARETLSFWVKAFSEDTTKRLENFGFIQFRPGGKILYFNVSHLLIKISVFVLLHNKACVCYVR